ncbi:MAG: hypothetical protein LBS37_03670, partial [Treponema sp.]|nr:hypothetical protein [Treponema sp.]
ALFRHMFYQIYQRGQFAVHKRLLIFLQGIILPTCLSTLFATITDILYTRTKFASQLHITTLHAPPPAGRDGAIILSEK